MILVGFTALSVEIKTNFLTAYSNYDEVVGMSVKKKVTATEEWCAEAYMETDYSSITEKDFELTIKKYAIYKAVGVDECEVSENEDG